MLCNEAKYENVPYEKRNVSYSQKAYGKIEG